MAAELARAGGPLAAVGLAVLLAAGRRELRLAGLAAWALGAALLAPLLAPDVRAALLVAGAVGGAALAVLLAAVFVRRPWLAALAALACVPARIPVRLDGDTANLLLPLYGVAGGVVLALAWQLAQGDRRARELGALTLPLAAFVAWAGLTLAWSDDVREGAVTLAAFVLPFGVLALWVARLDWSRRWLTALYAQLALMAAIFAAIGIYQWRTEEVFWNPKVSVANAYAPFYRVNSVFWDPSVYGRFLVVALLASLVVVLAAPRGRVAAAGAAAIVVTWLGLVLSFSQSSFAALAVGVLGAAAVAWRWRALAAAGLAAVVLLAVGFSAPTVRHALSDDLDRATSYRSTLVSNGLRIAADHPLAGVGLGGFKRAYAERVGLRGDDPKRAASHNAPVTVAAETGFVGLALFAWLLGAAVLAPLRRASWSFAGRASLIVALCMLAIAVHSLFYAAFFEDPTTWGLFGLGALVVAWRRSERREAA